MPIFLNEQLDMFNQTEKTSNSFHNTTMEFGNTLIDYTEKAISQQEEVLSFFKKNQNKYFTPFQINKLVLPTAPITSVRRAITNLTNSNYLIKTSSKKLGEYGRDNYLWTFNSEIK